MSLPHNILDDVWSAQGLRLPGPAVQIGHPVEVPDRKIRACSNRSFIPAAAIAVSSSKTHDAWNECRQRNITHTFASSLNTPSHFWHWSEAVVSPTFKPSISRRGKETEGKIGGKRRRQETTDSLLKLLWFDCYNISSITLDSHSRALTYILQSTKSKTPKKKTTHIRILSPPQWWEREKGSV